MVKYITASVVYVVVYSKVLPAYSRATWVISRTARMETREESFNREMKSFPNAGQNIAQRLRQNNEAHRLCIGQPL